MVEKHVEKSGCPGFRRRQGICAVVLVRIAIPAHAALVLLLLLPTSLGREKLGRRRHTAFRSGGGRYTDTRPGDGGSDSVQSSGRATATFFESDSKSRDAPRVRQSSQQRR